MTVIRPVTLVTGGTGVVGAAVVQRLVESGRRVAVAFRGNVEVMAQLRTDLDVSEDQLLSISADLSHTEGVARVLHALTSPALAVEGLVHAAALVDQTPMETLTSDHFAHVLAINVTSGFLLSRELSKQPSFRAVVLLSSIAADRAGTGSLAYEASKGAVNSLVRGLACELAPRIRVNGVAPGVVRSHRTDRDPTLSSTTFIQGIPGGQLVDRDHLARVVEFLLSEHSRPINGQIITVDEGMSLRLA